MGIYVAGPMRGILQFNFPAFYACEEWLREIGNFKKVYNPARVDTDGGLDVTDMVGGNWELEEVGFDLKAAMKADDDYIKSSQCTGIVMLPGWSRSTGATAEKELFESCKQGQVVWYYHPDVPRDSWRLRNEPMPEDQAPLVGLPGGGWGLNPDFVADQCVRPANVCSQPSPARMSNVVYDEHCPPDTIYAINPDYIRTNPPWQFVAAQGEAGDLFNGEVRTTDPDTGGQKGAKLARFDLIPAGPLAQIAEHYGKGAAKYEDRNWEKGYDWSLSYAALQRHANAFWGGEDQDPETGSHHMAAVAFHAMALMQFELTHPEKDNRP